MAFPITGMLIKEAQAQATGYQPFLLSLKTEPAINQFKKEISCEVIERCGFRIHLNIYLFSVPSKLPKISTK